MRWKAETESDMASLESAVKEVESCLGSMYSEPELNQLEYRLHAVMVHEGSVNSGHYWAYVMDSKREGWLKFNDNAVNEATWEELQKESVGGHSNASAYSLVYLRSSKSEMLMSSDQEQSTASGNVKLQANRVVLFFFYRVYWRLRVGNLLIVASISSNILGETGLSY